MGRAVRIGVVADTHVGEFLDALPAAVPGMLAGCDLILHAGDLSSGRVLRALEAVAPVVAVRGDHDLPDAAGLPAGAVVAIGGWRIGLIHGNRSWPVDAAVVMAGLAAGRNVAYRAGLSRALVRRLGALDVIVHGHWHEPSWTRVGGTLVFSPGAVCPWGSLEGGHPLRPGRVGIADRAVGRYRRQLGAAAMRPRVGIIDTDGGVLRARSLVVPVE